MVENSMVRDRLTEQMIEAGAALTQKLDELGVPITAALWFFKPDINEWRLLFSSPDISTKGPLHMYKQIRLAIDQLGQRAAAAPMAAVGLVDDYADLVKGLRKAVHTGPEIRQIRFSKNVANGHYIDDALIYRVQ